MAQKPKPMRRLTEQQTERFFRDLPAKQGARIEMLCYLDTGNPAYAIEAFRIIVNAGIGLTRAQQRSLVELAEEAFRYKPGRGRPHSTAERDRRIVELVHWFKHADPGMSDEEIFAVIERDRGVEAGNVKRIWHRHPSGRRMHK
jgi:hypothetical protein